jgi:hypothetical protein
MGVLNIRGLDDGLLGLVKAEAARRRVTLRELVAEYLAVCVPASGTVERQPAPARVEARVIERATHAEPIERVRKVVKDSQQPNYLDMKPSDVLRAMREASYAKRNDTE